MPALHAYIPAQTTQQMPIRWSGTQIPMVFVHNPTDITPSQSSTIVNEVLSAWNAVTPLPIVSTGFGSNVYSYSTDTRYFGPGVVAVTVLSYDPAVGRVSNGNIYVNQTASRGFCLTADKAANTCTTAGAGLLTKVYLGDVVAHEMGHLMGLAHSEVRDSTMLFTTFKGQSSPHADDIAGLRKIYGVSGYGALSGVVQGGNHVPVFGAHVQAISSSTGIIAGSSLSAEDGTFSIAGLPLNDSYYIYTEPLRDLEPLPDAYRSAKKNFCPGDYVGSFFETCGTDGKGHPQPLKLSTTQSSLDVGVVTIRCNVRVGEDYLADKLNNTGGTYEFTASTSKPGQTFVGHYSSTDVLPTSSYSSTLADTLEIDLGALTVPSGSVVAELSIVTASIGSALDFSVEIDGPYGLSTDADRGGIATPALDSSTLRPKYDRRITYPLTNNPALNRLTVRLMPRALTAYETAVHMPVPEYFVLKDRPWFLNLRILRNGASYYENQTSVISDNTTCVDAPYTFAVRANPVSAAALAGNAKQEEAPGTTAATCGTWQPPSSGGPGAGPWGGTLIVGLLLGLLIRHRRFSH